jgi:tRNA (guanine-N7-)-methyltransferase
MGRRALPKINPNVDVSGHLGFVEDLEAPFDPQSLFSRPADLEIEVGSGKGLFVLSESEKSPHRNFLGNEVSRKYCRYAAYRLAQNDRTNAQMLSGDGLRMFREFLPDQCAVAVHVYFPDPWWKSRHRQRRVMRPEFIKDIERVLKPEGIFHFWTDVEEYFHETHRLMAAHSTLDGPHDVPEKAPEHDMDSRTHFERRMRRHSKPIYRSQYHKS